VHCDFSFNLIEGFSKGEYDLLLIKREPQGPAGGTPVWRDLLVWVCSPRFVPDPKQPIPLVLAPSPDVYRKRALTALQSANRDWRVAFTSASNEGLQAAVRAGLGVTVLSKGMVPQGLKLLGAEHGLPAMPDAEIALYRAPGVLSRAAELLAEDIIHSLEIGAGQLGAEAIAGQVDAETS
jgi:DNA-binding transcriptional LysR family regulator